MYPSQSKRVRAESGMERTASGLRSAQSALTVGQFDEHNIYLRLSSALNNIPTITQ